MDVRILVVEDNNDFQERIRSILEDLGFSYDLASTAEDAIRFLETGTYDLVISDKRMKLSNKDTFEDNDAGIKIMERIAEIGMQCYKVIITAYGDTKSQRTAFRNLDVYDYIDKGTNFMDDFVTCITDVIEKVKGEKIDRVYLLNGNIFEGIVDTTFKFEGRDLFKSSFKRHELISIENKTGEEMLGRLRFIDFEIQLKSKEKHTVSCQTEQFNLKTENGTKRISMQTLKQIKFANSSE